MSKYVITYNYLPEVERTELDLQLYTDLERKGATRDDIQDSHDLERVGFTDGWSGEIIPIRVKELKEIIDGLPPEATHIEILYHCDHQGYHFYPVQITLREQKESEEKAKLRVELDRKIAELEKRQAELNDSIKNLLKTRKKLGK